MTCCGADPAEALARLQDNARAGRRPALFPFYGHRPSRSGVGPWVLSQWAPLPFTVNDVTYPHAEAYMMAAKAKLFHDEDALEQILQGGSPARVKALGRAVRGFDQAVWDEHAFGLVVQGNIAKFNQNLAAGAFLASTGPALLVETSPHDRIWGIGLATADPAAPDPLRWRGRNLLGFALTHTRNHHLNLPTPPT